MSFRSAVRRVVSETFPWIERFGFTASGDLEIKSATSKIELAGGDAPVALMGSGCTRLAFYPGVPSTTPPSLWVSNSAEAPFAWSLVAVTIVTGPTPIEPGTQVEIITGSPKVKSG